MSLFFSVYLGFATYRSFSLRSMVFAPWFPLWLGRGHIISRCGSAITRCGSGRFPANLRTERQKWQQRQRRRPHIPRYSSPMDSLAARQCLKLVERRH